MSKTQKKLSEMFESLINKKESPQIKKEAYKEKELIKFYDAGMNRWVNTYYIKKKGNKHIILHPGQYSGGAPVRNWKDTLEADDNEIKKESLQTKKEASKFVRGDKVVFLVDLDKGTKNGEPVDPIKKGTKGTVINPGKGGVVEVKLDDGRVKRNIIPLYIKKESLQTKKEGVQVNEGDNAVFVGMIKLRKALRQEKPEAVNEFNRIKDIYEKSISNLYKKYNL